MKYMLMMHAPRAGWEQAGIATWPPEDIKAHIGFMKQFAKELKDAGELVGAEGLASPEQARVVRAGKDGAPEVTDGAVRRGQGVPRRLLDRRRRDARSAPTRSPREASAAPGTGGAPMNMPIEVRQVMSAPPESSDLGAERRHRAPAARARAAGARRRGPALRRLRRRRGRGAGGAARGGAAVARATACPTTRAAG